MFVNRYNRVDKDYLLDENIMDDFLVRGGFSIMAAKMVVVQNLKPGDILADVVLSMSGKILLGKDITLSPRHISLLKTWDVQNVFINSDEEQTVVEEQSVAEAQPVADPLQQKARKVNSKEYFEFVKQQNSIITDVAKNFDVIRNLRIIPVSHLKDAVENIHSSIATNSFEVMNYLLVGDQKLTDFIPQHSVMVAYFSGLIARKMRWDEGDIAGVALASLLHDIGNLTTNKIDDSRVQTHIAEMASLFKKTKGLSNEVILGSIQHRERANGSGFPTRVKGDQIHPYARIIAVADFFHNLAYTDKYANPFPVLDRIVLEMFEKFDPQVCMAFVNQVKDSLLFNRILLSNGQEAQIIFFHPNTYSSPVVKTMDGQIIDLAKSPHLNISQIVTSK